MLSINIFLVKFLNEMHPSIFCPIKNRAICMVAIAYTPAIYGMRTYIYNIYASIHTL